MRIEIDINGNITEHEDAPISITAEELAQQAIQIKINEAQVYLAKTDYKMLNNYVPKEDEDLQAVITQRNTYREFIRENS